MLKTIRPIFILLLLSAFLYFFMLGNFSLYNAAETTYGEFIKQIRLTGDWLTMHYNGQIIFDKPPLYFWLAAITTYIIGFNEFAIRFWAAFCGVLTVITTYFLGKKFYNERVGFLSGIIVMTAFQFLIQSRIAELDIVLTLCITLALLCFYIGYTEGKTKYYWGFYVATAFATLIKGIIGLALPGFAIFLFLLIKKDLPRLKEMKILPGLLIYLIISAPWYIAEGVLHGSMFTEFVVGFLFLSRFQSVVSGHPGPWYYYFLALILGFAPWSHFLPYAFIRTWRQGRRSFTNDLRLTTYDQKLLMLCFIIPIFIIFSLAKTKLPNYVLPLYPFLAIMVAKLWDDFWGEEKNRLWKGMAVANGLLAVVVILIIIGFILLGTNQYAGPYREQLWQLQLLAGILVAGSSISILAFFCRQYKVSFYALPAMVFIITFVLTTLTLPTVEKYKGEKELGQLIGQNLKPGQKIAAYDTGNRPGIVFYNSQPIIFLQNHNQLITFLHQQKGFCITSPAEYEKVKKLTRLLGQRGKLVVVY
ncbi:MAG: glycosyltransferase family 39 protein [Candidatus Margulisbacteria bacterium]|nr:glycosyltransferase family 39 protein [Candidatus Margulisiibacteriota bacterium]